MKVMRKQVHRNSYPICMRGYSETASTYYQACQVCSPLGMVSKPFFGILRMNSGKDFDTIPNLGEVVLLQIYISCRLLPLSGCYTIASRNFPSHDDVKRCGADK